MTAGYVGLLLRVARERAGVGLLDMAEATGQHPRRLSRMEEGRPGRPVTAAVVKAYEQILGVPLVEAAARLGVPGLEPGLEPSPGPVGAAATSAAEAGSAEPVRQLAEAVRMLACEIRNMRNGQPFLPGPSTGEALVHPIQITSTER